MGRWKIHVAVHSCWKTRDGQLKIQNSDSVIWFKGAGGGSLRVSTVWPIYTRLEISMWQGFPSFSANLCSHSGFPSVKPRQGREDQSLSQDWRRWFRTTGNFNCGSLRVHCDKLQPRFSLESLHVNSWLVFADKSSDWRTLCAVFRVKDKEQRLLSPLSDDAYLSQNKPCPLASRATDECRMSDITWATYFERNVCPGGPAVFTG